MKCEAYIQIKERAVALLQAGGIDGRTFDQIRHAESCTRSWCIRDALNRTCSEIAEQLPLPRDRRNRRFAKEKFSQSRGRDQTAVHEARVAFLGRRIFAWPKNEELAILTVNGMQYRDWESVLVKHALKEHPWIHFRFTCSEGMPLAKNWAAMRIIPGMECTVTLAGQPVPNAVDAPRPQRR
jgi:hypothetical protein